eukprot:TRINITY_DN63097_c0_g1_i1.p1 TRINITY_DN63097_c0_g1~~TRINITY_DN63097_c0_g1_i1.p1  ORF type:complete len:224 (-),score=33.04 TRINITY_DN63097_c0_g1_i1:32-703(-)
MTASSTRPSAQGLSEIECGQELVDGSRVYTEYNDFFQREVMFFFATSDKSKSKLYRASELSKLLECDHCRLGMYLKRNREDLVGVYKASTFKFKPGNVLGLKSGGYYLSEQCCRRVFSHLCKVGGDPRFVKTTAQPEDQLPRTSLHDEQLAIIPNGILVSTVAPTPQFQYLPRVYPTPLMDSLSPIPLCSMMVNQPPTSQIIFLLNHNTFGTNLSPHAIFFLD